MSHPSKRKKQQVAVNAAQNRRRADRLASYFHTNPSDFGDTNRNDSASYGYPDHITFYHMYNFYNRSGFAQALIDIIPDRCFSEGFSVLEDGEQDTKFAMAVKDFNRKHKMLKVWREAFKQRDLGQYSTIVPIFIERASTSELQQPITKAAEAINVNPFYQIECEGCSTFVSDLFDPDYNKPEYYQYNPSALMGRQTTNAEQYDFHRSRVFVLTTASTGIFGQPALEAPYNALFDANKIRGAGAEGYRKNAKQRTILSANDAQAAKAMASKQDEIDESIDDFENQINAMLKLAGVDATVLQSRLEDPTGAHTIAMQEACAARGIPVTEVIGFMTGERSSTQNSSTFSKRLKSTQNNDYGPTMIDFYMWLANLGVLPQPTGDVTVDWADIAEPTTAEKLDNAKNMVEQNEKATRAGQEPPWTTEEIRKAGGYEEAKPETDYELNDLKSDADL